MPLLFRIRYCFYLDFSGSTCSSNCHLTYASSIMANVHHLASSPFAGRMLSSIHVDTATPAQDDPVRTSSVVARNSPGRGIWAYHGFLARILEKKCRGMFFIQVWFPGQDLCDGNAPRRNSPTTRDAVTTRRGSTKTYVNKRLTAISRRRRNKSVLLCKLLPAHLYNHVRLRNIKRRLESASGECE